MRTLNQVLRKVENDFRTNRHLDLEPWQDTAPSAETDTYAAGDILVSRSRQLREAELLKPVTRVEIELVDNHIGDERWNITHARLDTLSRSRAFQSLTQTAAAKGFGFNMRTETHLNRRHVLSLRITLVFKSFEAFKYEDLELLWGEEGRTHMWYEHP